MKRKEVLEIGYIYHIFNKSIAEYKIFNNHEEFSRMIELIRYYQTNNLKPRYSKFIELQKPPLMAVANSDKLVDIIAYCLMPTHIHLILKQLKKDGISIFVGNILNSYTRYFNTKHKRKGPLWESKFKGVLIDKDEQLFHLTRYIHLNPVTAYLIDKPEDWQFSSYKEYLGEAKDRICKYDDILDIKRDDYREFVEDRIFYQRELAGIKDFLIDN